MMIGANVETFFSHHAKRIVLVSDSGCWVWMGALTNAGYGEVKIDGAKMLAHRVAAMADGILTDPANVVRHRCDVRCCVNPDHLIEGEQADNVADMVARERQSRGSSRPRAILSEADVAIIRQLLADGVSQSLIARRFGVCQPRISRINTKKLWRHVA